MAQPEREPDGTSGNTLERVNHALTERVKELNCLYAISELSEKPGGSLEQILQGTVDIIPTAWQYPELACARILLGDQRFESRDFKETAWKMSAGILVGEEKQGILEICYKGGAPVSAYDGPFLEEEFQLIKAIAEKLGRILWSKRAEASLRESEERYRSLAEHVADGVTLQQDGRLVFANRAFTALFGLKPREPIVGAPFSEIIEGAIRQSTETLMKTDERGLPREQTFRVLCTARNGREFLVEGDHLVIQLLGKPAVLSTFRDCTEKVRQERTMQEEAELLRLENIHLRSSMKERYRFRNILGKSPAMQEVYELILKAAHSDASTTILGESGTGKELVARAIHELSSRGKEEFVTVNCGAIPENLLESEFFGHKRGAFTGAYADKAGYLDIADGGTLFLDEAGELTLNMQVKLLRALDGGQYTPVGTTRPKRSAFRVIAATNRDLRELVKEGCMREDFFYRIHVIAITLPPLRERKEDIPLLVDHFLRRFRAEGQETRIPARILDAMLNYSWPGNVRELQNVIRRYLSVGQWDFMNRGTGAGERPALESYTLRGAVEETERAALRKALETTRWNKTRAAQILGISRRALFRKMKSLELD